jgi:ribosome biogenesis GTPase
MAFAPFKADGCVPGRVALEHNHVFRVLTGDGERLAETAGRLRHRAMGRQALPVVGDWVALRPDPGGRSRIEAVLPRTSAISRRAAGRETEEQVLAANVDLLFIVFGLDTHVKPRAIERYLAVARQSGAHAVVLLNKADVVEDAAALGEDVEIAEAAAGETPVLAVSTKSGAGMDAIEALIDAGKTVALVGPSGVGKSTIVNRIVGSEVLPTGEVREWDARGRHTSVHRQLVLREAGGLVIDTPGIRELALWNTDGVAGGFTDIETLAADCRFRDCRHETEPGCGVKAAVESGTLDADRYASFLKLQQEQDELARRRDERAAIDAKRVARQQHKSVRALYKDRQRRGHR